MGIDDRGKHNSTGNASPQHLVALQEFEIGAYPVTVAEYDCAVQAGAVQEPPNWFNQLQKTSYQEINPLTGEWAPYTESLKGRPVVNITWNDALAYVRWLATLTGQPWRLPTEAEWEKAARGEDGRLYPWGNKWDNTRANTSAGGSKAITKVGEYQYRTDTSPYEVHDLAGNVREWCSSRYKPYPYEPNDGRENLESDGEHVLRGGSFEDDPRDAQTISRGHLGADELRPFVGFRLAQSTVNPNELP